MRENAGHAHDGMRTADVNEHVQAVRVIGAQGLPVDLGDAVDRHRIAVDHLVEGLAASWCGRALAIWTGDVDREVGRVQLRAVVGRDVDWAGGDLLRIRRTARRITGGSSAATLELAGGR